MAMMWAFFTVLVVGSLWLIVTERRDQARIRRQRSMRDWGGHVEVLTDEQCDRLLQWMREEHDDA